MQLSYGGHTIDHYYGDRDAPESLEGLERAFDGLAGTDAWVGSAHVFAQPYGSYCP